MKSRRGIYYDLVLSEHIVEHGNFKFYFSSAIHKQKFLERFHEAITETNYQFNKKYGCKFEMRNYAICQLYKQIETRGFLIEFKGVKITSWYNLKFVGVSQITLNCEESPEISINKEEGK